MYVHTCVSYIHTHINTYIHTYTVVSCKYAPSCISPTPPAFLSQSLAEVFYPAHKPPPFVETPTHSGSRWWNGSARTKPASTKLLKFLNGSQVCLSHGLGCLMLNCLLRIRTARSIDGHASYFAEAPCFLVPQR